MLRLAATRTTTAAAAACARTARPCGSVGAATATSSFSTSTPVRKDDVVLKTDLVASLAEEHDLKTAQANRIVSGLFDSIVEVRLVPAHTPTCMCIWCSFWALVVGGSRCSLRSSVRLEEKKHMLCSIHFVNK